MILLIPRVLNKEKLYILLTYYRILLDCHLFIFYLDFSSYCLVIRKK